MTTTATTPSDGVVVVGAGLAGANVVEELRTRGYTGPVTLVGESRTVPMSALR